MIDQEFDGPLFKRLSHNDSGASSGNQAGFLIPKAFRGFFPLLPAPTDYQPAPHVQIMAILSLDGEEPLQQMTNWQYQSWGNSRPPESRITGGLEAIRKPSSEGDLLLIERGKLDWSLYRLTVLRKGSWLFAEMDRLTNGAPAGFIYGPEGILTDATIIEAENQIAGRLSMPFRPFDDAAPLLNQTRRTARAHAFRRQVLDAYGHKCAFCGGGIRVPGGSTELEAAHIIPKAMKGTDDVRNGLALCRQHHWAFDQRLIGITLNRTLRLAPNFYWPPENAVLAGCNGVPVLQPIDPAQASHREAIRWSISSFDRHWGRSNANWYH